MRAIRLAALAAALVLTGCAGYPLSGSLEVPSRFGTAVVRADARGANVAVQLAPLGGYAK